MPKHLSPALQEEIDIIIASYWLRRDEASRHAEMVRLMQIAQAEEITATPQYQPIEIEATKLNAFLDVAKKIIDLFDDVWYLALLAIRNNITPSMFNLINAFMTASIGSMVLVAEAVNGLQVAHHAYFKNNHHREAHITAGLLIFATGMTGLGLSVALCLGTLGVPVIGLDLLPIIIPSLLVVIYSIEMLRDAYIFRQAQKADSAAEHEIMTTKTVLENLAQNTPCNDQEFSACQSTLLNNIAAYDNKREERLINESALAFKILEVTTTNIACIGSALTLMPGVNIAASIPILLIASGMTLGMLFKLAERMDENNNYCYSRNLRNNIVNPLHGFFAKTHSRSPDSHSESGINTYSIKTNSVD